MAYSFVVLPLLNGCSGCDRKTQGRLPANEFTKGGDQGLGSVLATPAGAVLRLARQPRLDLVESQWAVWRHVVWTALGLMPESMPEAMPEG